MKTLFIACLALAMGGCATTGPVVAPQKDLIAVTPDMVDECSPSEAFTAGSEADLAMYAAGQKAAHEICIEKNHTKAQLIKKFFGVADKETTK